MMEDDCIDGSAEISVKSKPKRAVGAYESIAWHACRCMLPDVLEILYSL